MSLLKLHGWVSQAVLLSRSRLGNQIVRLGCTKAQRSDARRSCQLEKDRDQAGKAEGASACAGTAAITSGGYVPELMKRARFDTLQPRRGRAPLLKLTAPTRAVIAGSSKQNPRLLPGFSHLPANHERPEGFHSLAQRPAPRTVNSAATVLMRRLVKMYMDEENTLKATRDHWARSEAELNWLKAGAEKAVTGRCGSEALPSCPTKHGQTHTEKRRMIDELVAEWVNDYVANQKPLAYILGDVPFGDLTFAVRPPILIPRCETDEWVSRLSHMMGSYFERRHLLHDGSVPLSLQDPEKSFPAAYTILDLCTGSGCISNFLAHHHPMVQATGVDVDQDAVNLAKQNALAYGLTRERASFLHRDIFSPTFTSDLHDASQALGGFNMIVSNPPYITRAEYQTLAPSVKNWESSIALIGDRPVQRVGKDADLFLPSSAQCEIHQSFTSPRSPSIASGSSTAAATEDGLKRRHDTRELQSRFLETDLLNKSQDGLDFYRHILTLISSGHLLKNERPDHCTLPKQSGDELEELPRIVFEVGKGQAELVKKLVLEHLYERGLVTRVEIWKDFSGIERTVLGYQR